jgi:hypothetical protein
MPRIKHVDGVDIEMTPEEEAEFVTSLPPPFVPPIAPVSAAQAKLTLDDFGLLDEVEAIVAAHPVRAVKIWYDNANQWERGNPYIQALGIELGMGDERIDALFEAARLK